MELQTILALIIVLLALAWITRRFWRTVRAARVEKSGTTGCGDGGCGCG